MRRPGFRLTTLRLMIGVAALACPLFLIGQEFRRHRDGHRERCLHIADIHASTGIEYRRNAAGDPTLLRIAAWHEHMHRVFVEAQLFGIKSLHMANDAEVAEVIERTFVDRKCQRKSFDRGIVFGGSRGHAGVGITLAAVIQPQ